MFKSVNILNVENLDAGYGNNIVLKNVSFTLDKGEVLVVIGQNGSGKSTLLKILTGILAKKEGKIFFKQELQKNIRTENLIQNGISYFMQGGLIMPELTVMEHLHLAAINKGTGSGNTKIESIFFEFPNLKELKYNKTGNLSGGEKQMLSFAILMMQNTNTWLLDEPTSGLAPDMVQFTTDFLNRKNGEGITMLIVEHNIEVAFRLASHIVVAKDETLTKKYNQSEFLKVDFLDKIVYN